MLTFWIIAAMFVLLILWFVLPPFFQRAGSVDASTSDSANVLIYQNQLEELAADRKAGLIGEDQYQHEKDAIERRMLEDVATNKPIAKWPSKTGAKLGYAVAAFIPVGAVALYLLVGNPKALTSSPTSTVAPVAPTQQAGEMSPQQIAANVDKLAERLKQNPNDAQGWSMLARSYGSMERFADAAAAYEQLTKLQPNDADAWADYGEALALANGKNLAGKPIEAMNRALQIDPQNQKALALAGSAAFEAAAYDKAIAYWQRLMAQLPPNSDFAQRVSAQITKAKELAAGKRSR